MCLEYQLRGLPWESGIWLRNSTAGSLIHFGLTMAAGNALSLQSYKFSSATVLNSNYATAIPGAALLEPVNWLRYRDDGTNRYFEYSYNGIDWITYFSVGRTDFTTPDQIGWGLDNQGSGQTQVLRLRSFSVV
jgi:hypothetical protein